MKNSLKIFIHPSIALPEILGENKFTQIFDFDEHISLLELGQVASIKTSI